MHFHIYVDHMFKMAKSTYAATGVAVLLYCILFFKLQAMLEAFAAVWAPTARLFFLVTVVCLWFTHFVVMK
jgi:hypothetical protein